MTFASYAARWLDGLEGAVKPRTRAKYRAVNRLHLLPVFGARGLETITRSDVKALLATHRRDHARRTVAVTLAVLRTLMSAAVDDEVIVANPCLQLAKKMRLGSSAADAREECKAMTREELTRFLKAAEEAQKPLLFLCFWLLAHTGLRIGEALALKWDAVDFDAKVLEVRTTLPESPLEDMGPPKSGKPRRVDLRPALLAMLRAAHEHRTSDFVFRGRRRDYPMHPHTVRKACAQYLAAAGLPAHFTPHGLRHTFAALLLQKGESIQYVQRQLGHATITMTVDVYGKWLPVHATVDGEGA